MSEDSQFPCEQQLLFATETSHHAVMSLLHSDYAKLFNSRGDQGSGPCDLRVSCKESGEAHFGGFSPVCMFDGKP